MGPCEGGSVKGKRRKWRGEGGGMCAFHDLPPPHTTSTVEIGNQHLSCSHVAACASQTASFGPRDHKSFLFPLVFLTSGA